MFSYCLCIMYHDDNLSCWHDQFVNDAQLQSIQYITTTHIWYIDDCLLSVLSLVLVLVLMLMREFQRFTYTRFTVFLMCVFGLKTKHLHDIVDTGWVCSSGLIQTEHYDICNMHENNGCICKTCNHYYVELECKRVSFYDTIQTVDSISGLQCMNLMIAQCMIP